MSQELDQQEQSGLAQELDTALTSLDEALADAGKAVGTIRGQILQFAALAEIVQEMDEAMARARSSLRPPSASAAGLTPAPPLRAVPARPQAESEPAEAQPDAIEPEPLADASPVEAPLPQPIAPTEASVEQPEAPVEASQAEPQPIIASQTPEAPEPAPQPEPEAIAEAIGRALPSKPETIAEADSSPAVSHCLRLGVSSKTGSLDLTAVDGSVSENPAVVDVALLDYDGRQATLKLWINNDANPHGVREALLASLRRRLGDEQDADVRIDFEEGSAA